MKNGFVSTIFAVLMCLSCVFNCLANEQSDQQIAEEEDEESDQVGKIETVHFLCVAEPNEEAFWLLVPYGWDIKGGIISVEELIRKGLASQATEPKLDLEITSDESRNVMLHWLPDILYYDRRKELMGTAASVFMPPVEFLKDVVLPFQHPYVSDITILDEVEEIPELKRHYDLLFSLLQVTPRPICENGMLVVTYNENGVLYKEMLITCIRDFPHTGFWGNMDTFLFRAPEYCFELIEPVVKVMLCSIALDQDWVMMEIGGMIEEGNLQIDEFQLEDVVKEYINRREWIYLEMSIKMLPNGGLSSSYYNPITNESELGSDQWLRLWVNDRGDVVYTDDLDYDPNDNLDPDEPPYELCEDEDWIYDLYPFYY